MGCHPHPYIDYTSTVATRTCPYLMNTNTHHTPAVKNGCNWNLYLLLDCTRSTTHVPCGSHVICNNKYVTCRVKPLPNHWLPHSFFINKAENSLCVYSSLKKINLSGHWPTEWKISCTPFLIKHTREIKQSHLLCVQVCLFFSINNGM